MARKELPIRNQVMALLTQPGITHKDIARSLKCSITTISRIAQQVKPDVAAIDAKLAALQSEIGKVISVKERATQYAELAKSAKNEAVSLGALQRIDDLDGIVTQKELVRTRRDEAAQPQPMFIMPSGSSVNVTINQRNTTTSSNDLPNNGARQVKSLKPNEP